MELNGVNSYYTSYEAASNKKTAVKDTDNSTASKTQAMLQLLMSHLQTKAALQHHLLKVMLPIQHLSQSSRLTLTIVCSSYSHL